MSEPVELYRKYRPQKLSEMVGQDDAVKTLITMLKAQRLPHAILFTGPSGCGKTTMARILQRHLKCDDTSFQEINCADFRGIDMVREIRARMGLSPMMGNSTIYLIDESHRLTPDGQNALLKMLEDTPSHVYFFLATTDPLKLLPTIRTRCTEIRVKALAPGQMATLLNTIASKVPFVLAQDVVDKLVEMSEGSARKGLVLLNQIIGLGTVEEQLDAIEKSLHAVEAFKIAQLLLRGCKWIELTPVLKEAQEDPESIRYMVLGYANKVLLGGKNCERAALVIDFFSRSFVESKQAGLSAACYECTKPRK